MRQMYQIMTVLAIAMVVGVSGDTVHWGRTCPDVQPFPNLSVDKVLGIWYVVHKTDTANTCLMWNLTQGLIPGTFLVNETRQLFIWNALGYNDTDSATGNVDIPNPETPGKMRILWSTSVTGKADFTVFDTDYDNYMAVFECNRAGFFHRRSTAILSRTKTLNDEFIQRIHRQLSKTVVGIESLSTIEHDTCNQPQQ